MNCKPHVYNEKQARRKNIFDRSDVICMRQQKNKYFNLLWILLSTDQKSWFLQNYHSGKN